MLVVEAVPLFGLSARTPTLWPLLMIYHSSLNLKHGRWVSRAISPGENEAGCLAFYGLNYHQFGYTLVVRVTKIHSASKERKYRPHQLVKVMPICHFKKTMEDVRY